MTASTFLAAADACAKGCGDAKQVAEALSELESGSLWHELCHVGWERLRVAESQLRSFAIDELAKACCGKATSAFSELSNDLLRPPWVQLPSRVEDAFRTQPDELEVLCTVDCHPDMDDTGLCWHCWHKEECNGRPAEIQDLLYLARRLSGSASMSHRVRLAEERWSYFQQLGDAVAKLAPRKLLVIGGLGVSAVHAAQAVVLLPNASEAMQQVVRQVMRDNGAFERVTVVSHLDPIDLESFDACALEGFEPDGLLATGILEIWQQLRPQMNKAKVLPEHLRVSVALASSRLTEAAGVQVDLELFADAYGGLAPIPLAVSRSDRGTPLVPQQKSAKKNCLDLRLDEPWSTQTSGALSLALASAGSVDSLLLSWELFFESGKGWSGESLQALPARSHNLAAGDSVDLRWSCNSQRLWFEVPKLSLFTTAPLPRVFLLDWYAEMLNDASRNIAFARGIHQAIGKGGRVVDLGCGCGLLARLALRQNATEALAVEIAPHLARLAQRLLPEAKVICGDIRAVMVDEDQRFDLVVAELLDAGGLGEKIVPFLRHAKSRLLRPGGRCLPRSLRLRAALLDLRLSREGHGLDLSAWEPFWVPARASSGEWLGIDLDAGADWQPVSDVVDLFNLNFEASQGELIEALQEQEIDFKLFPDARRCNAVAWWFEADLGIGELGSCDLTSAPSRFRPASCEPTHWVQAVAGLGPFDHFTGERHLLMRVRTDGVQITWTPLNAPVPQEDHSFVAAWRQETAEVDQQLRDLERHLTTGGDLARLAAVKSAALMLAAQPNRFGLEATPEVVTRLLKALFV